MSKQHRIFYPALRVCQVWGTRKGVGKTIFSTVMCWAAARARRAKGARDHVGYLNPLATGSPDEAGDVRVRAAFHKLLQGKTLPKFFKSSSLYLHQPGLDSATPEITDKQLLSGIHHYVADRAEDLDPPGGWLVVETLDDINAPLPSGNCQADVYKSLGLPAILVGDAADGGVDGIIPAFESLRQRDYEVPCVVVFKDAAEDYLRIVEHFEKLDVYCLQIRAIPERHENPIKDRNNMKHYFSGMARANAMKDLLRSLDGTHNQRVKALLPSDDGDDGEENPMSAEKKSKGQNAVSNLGWDRRMDFSFAVPGKHKHKI